MQSNIQQAKPKRKWLKRLIIIAVIIILVPIVFGFIIDIYPQLLIGLFQGYQNQNSFEPRNGATPGRSTKENGIVYLNDIKYADEYPNSYLDISYPNKILRKSVLPSSISTAAVSLAEIKRWAIRWRQIMIPTICLTALCWKTTTLST